MTDAAAALYELGGEWAGVGNAKSGYIQGVAFCDCKALMVLLTDGHATKEVWVMKGGFSLSYLPGW